jgi:ABC-2 type transport system ATP-binding protein
LQKKKEGIKIQSFSLSLYVLGLNTKSNYCVFMNPDVVIVKNLHKVYGNTTAVENVSFSVAEGEIFGVLGPNGAGKTTTVECISGLRTPDSGSIRILGFDPQTDRDELREAIGVQLQEGSLPPAIKVKEALELFKSFYRESADADELLDVLGLREKCNDRFKRLSGGQKQRLSIALALIGNPKIAILDELTTGLDPQARRETWQFIETMRSRGVTLILVTHFMDEAERLCDRVIIINRGKIVAAGTPAALASSEGGQWHMRFLPSAPFPDEVLTRLTEVISVEHEGRHIAVIGRGDLSKAVHRALAKLGVEAKDVLLRSGSLEDAFIRIISADTRKASDGGAES